MADYNMHKRVLAVLLVGLEMVIIGMMLPGCQYYSLQPSLPMVKAYFTYPGTTLQEDDNPKRKVIIPLIDRLDQGNRLDLAMYILTDHDIRDALLRAWHRGAQIRVYLEGEDACAKGSDGPALLLAGIPVKVDNKSGLMHHKFAVINKHTVITGSYNWSNAADTRNLEDLLVINNYEVARQYTKNFELMWNKYAAKFQGC